MHLRQFSRHNVYHAKDPPCARCQAMYVLYHCSCRLISQVKQGAVTQTHDAQANRRAPKRRSTVNNGKPNLMNGPGSGYLSGNATVGTPLAESTEEDPSKSAVHTEEDTAAKTDLIPVASNALILGKDVDSTLALMDSQPVSQASRHVSRQASRASSDPPARAVKVRHTSTRS